jgi:enoyl-CoA hydratase/3-hydroxyacyl-CoA dehydrogenase
MKVGIAGAGNMGSGIAQKYATEGHDVVVFDNSQAGLGRGKALIEKTLQEAVSRALFNEARAAEIATRLHFSNNLSELKDADLVIEAIFEDFSAKQALFHELDALCDPKTILATNTSSFRVKELAGATQRANRVVGLHYFYHPAKNRLVEVIRADETSDETFNTIYGLQESIGKIPITSADSPGFVVNRFFVPWLNEAMRLVEEGVANIPTVEWAAKKCFEIGMGPFELMNVTGVPITLHAATTLYNELGDFYKPSDLNGSSAALSIRTPLPRSKPVSKKLFSRLRDRWCWLKKSARSKSATWVRALACDGSEAPLK